MNIIHLSAVHSDDPTDFELAAIEQEWPLIAAELDLLDAQIAYDNAGPSPSVLDRRRVRRAEHHVLAVSRELADHDPASEVVA